MKPQNQQNSAASTLRSSLSMTQWRFALLFLVIGNPLFVWPILGQGTDAFWQSLMFWSPLIAIHGLIPLLDFLLGNDDHAAITDTTPLLNKAFPALCLPAWYAVLLTACYAVSFGEMSTFEIVGIVLSLGAMGGVLAINPAHELIHRNTPLERNLGGLLLSGVCYGAFKVEHVRGHHLNAATSKDTASARKGDNTFAFTLRSMWGTMLHAHELESQRLSRLGFKPRMMQWWLKNEMIRWNAASLVIAALISITFGWFGLVIFLLASLGAIFELEVVNFIEHYGLTRKALPESSRFEPVQEHHSWNTNTLASNVFLFNLQRHSDHHAHAGKDYLHLSSISNAPQLPFGYSVMFLVALCPPLWRTLMDHRIPAESRAN
jgi:alkane 1-monooxygenase